MVTVVRNEYGPLVGNAMDTRDCLLAVDRWLVLGTHRADLDAAIREQQWPEDAIEQLAQAWVIRTGLRPGGGPIQRGHGWRVWYDNGSVINSTQQAWATVPHGIVLAVSYHGPDRWLAQGRDPFWLTPEGLVHDARTWYPDGHENPRWALHAQIERGERTFRMVDKEGMWVSDQKMQRFRWLACMAVTL